jgi:hypothetical protein
MATPNPIEKEQRRRSSIPLGSPIAPDPFPEGRSIATPATSLLLAGSNIAKGKRRRDTETGISGSEESTPRHRNEGPGSNSEMDEESVIDAHLEYNGAWERFNIVKPKRQEWIIQRAKAAARDYEIKSRYKFSKGEFDRVVMSGVNCLAEQCYNMSRKKISSQASTPLTGIYMEMANTSTGIHAIDYSHDLGTPQTENKGVRFETEALKGDRGQTTPPMDPT